MFRLLLSILVAFSLGTTGWSAPKKTISKTPAKKAATKSTAKKPAAKAAVKPAEEKKELAPGELPLFARAALAMDAKTGEVLYEKNADEIEYPASSTKMLTALVVIESGDLDKLVTIEEADADVEPSALYIRPGETYTRRALLYVLMIKSANDVAQALARDNAGSIEAFGEKMTERAFAAGAVSSNFKNPHGLHDPHHYTTARDLAKITRAAMQNELLREIASTVELRIRKDDEWMLFKTRNRLLTQMPEYVGGKTGYTRAAQQVLVSAAEKEGAEAISVVLHTNKPGIWDDSKLLLEHGLAKLLAPPPEPTAPEAPAAAEAAAATPAETGANAAASASRTEPAPQ